MGRDLLKLAKVVIVFAAIAALGCLLYSLPALVSDWEWFRFFFVLMLSLLVDFWPCTASVAVVVVAVFLLTLRPRTQRADVCPSCGYSLAGLSPGSTCPECGREGARGKA